MRSSAWLLRRRAPSKKAEEASSSSQEEVVRIGITTRIETAVTVKTVTIRYRFKAKVNRFTMATKLDKVKPMMDAATLIHNQKSATRTRVEIVEIAATRNETTRDRMVLVVMVLMVAAAEEKVAAGVAVAEIRLSMPKLKTMKRRNRGGRSVISFSTQPLKLSLAKTKITSNRALPCTMPSRSNHSEEVVKVVATADSSNANKLVTRMMLASMKR